MKTDNSYYCDDGGGAGGEYTNANPTPANFPSDAMPNVPINSTFDHVSMQEMFDMMLYPELFPVLVAPNSAFTLTEAGLQEVGRVIATLHFNATFSRGSITPAYGTSGYRSGLPNNYNYTGSGLPADVASVALSNAQTVNTYTVLSGVQNWVNSVDYDGGEQPLSSKHNNFNSPLAAGTTTNRTVSINGVYPYFAKTVDITVMTQQALSVMNATYVQTNMVAEDAVNKQVIDLPVAWSAITGVQVFNTIAGAWEWLGGSKANSLTLFDVTATTHNVQGSVINYNRFTHNSVMTGARQLRWYTT
jgi:hypothetical protein